MQPEAPPSPESASIKLVSHSMLFYWWPVWAVGLLFGVLSLLSGSRLAIVPEGARLRPAGETAPEQTFELIVPKDRAGLLLEAARAKDDPAFRIPVDPNKNFGIVFCVVLLVVIFSTNIPLR